MAILITGCFDVIHAGHIRLLRQAAAYIHKHGCIHICLDTDARVRESKGSDRPINNWHDRRMVLSGIKDVGFRNIHPLDTDFNLIEYCKILNPVRIVGEEYKTKPIIGAEYCKEIIYIDRYADLSTTNILKRGAIHG